MKRFFMFIMAVWALLSISQTVKAADVTVYFQCPSTGFEVNDNDNHVYTSKVTKKLCLKLTNNLLVKKWFKAI